MEAIGLAVLIVLMFIVLFAPRQWALLGMMGGVIYLTQGQTIQIGGFNIFPTRFLELAGFLRVMARREFTFHQLNKLDHALLWLYTFTTIVFLLRSKVGQAYQIGTAVDAFLSYFAFRGLVSDMKDLRWFLRAFVLLLVPYASLVLIERFTNHNPFALIGGQVGGSNWMRHGHPRCFGSFRQPDTLGMFAASFLPLYIGLTWFVEARRRALLAICLCLVIAWASNSGGPAAAVVTGMLAWAFWRLRAQMRKVRWGIVAFIIVLALVMKAPVWFIFARASSITGGDGWHRSELIDVFYHHIGEWWLAGIPIKHTAGWMPYDLNTTGGADITNQFLSFGVAAGVGGILLFMLLLTRAFSQLGKALAAVRSHSRYVTEAEILLWGLGVMLVVHIVDWFGITYFDQMYMVFFMQLAAISGIAQKYSATVPVPLPAADFAGDQALADQLSE